jgi:type II secretory pathway component PulF
MARFTYSARSMAGEKAEGTVEAADRRAALAQLERLGLVPVAVTEAGAAGPALPRPRAAAVAAPAGRPRMGLAETLQFTRELSDLLAAGMTLGDALHLLSRGGREKGRDAIVAALRDDIVRGRNLSDALAAWPQVFPPLYVSLVQAGEAGGGLDESLRRIVAHYERVQATREKVVGALVYPAIVLVVGIGTVIFIMSFVVPRFAAMFRELGSTLPGPTRLLIALSGFFTGARGLVLLGVVAAAVFFARQALHTPAGRRWWHARLLRLPLARRIVTAAAFSQFAQTLGSLLANGVQVLEALRIVERTVGNVVIAGEIRAARERVTDGSTISGPLAQGKVFPPILTEMLAVGERTGDLPGALGHIARRYETELDRGIRLFVAVLEPALIVGIALVVGFVVISMLLAVFDLTSGLKV